MVSVTVSVFVAVRIEVEVRPRYVVTVFWTTSVCVGRDAEVDTIVDVGTGFTALVPSVVRQVMD